MTFDKIPGNYSILTNPPYKYAEKFVLKSLDLLSENNYCIMFLKLTFLEGKSRLKNLYSKYPPKYVYVFSERQNCVINGDFDNVNTTGAVCYAWFIWQKGCTSETIVRWL